MGKGMSGSILMYDLTQESTLEGCQFWLDRLREQAAEDVVVMLVGNKADLLEEDPTRRRVSTEAVESFMRKNGIFKHFEASALNGINVKEAFNGLIHEVHRIAMGGEPTTAAYPDDNGGGFKLHTPCRRTKGACNC